MRSKSTELMNQIIDFVDKTYLETGRTPTYREIANELNITSACVSNYIKEMVKRDMIENSSGSRGIITKSMQGSLEPIIQVPVVGSVSCGPLLLAEQNIDYYIPILKTLLGSGKYFILTANGNSMVNAGIDNGDKVLVRVQESAEQGQIVVALVDNEATLKRYYVDEKKQKIRLHPENDEMEDMFFDNIVIQGIAVKVIKDL